MRQVSSRRRGGFVHIVDWQGRPVVRERMHWVAAEATATNAALWVSTGDPSYDRWCRTWWDHVATVFSIIGSSPGTTSDVRGIRDALS